MKQLYVKCIDPGVHSKNIIEDENYPIFSEDNRSDTYEIRDNTGKISTYYRWRFSKPFKEKNELVETSSTKIITSTEDLTINSYEEAAMVYVEQKVGLSKNYEKLSYKYAKNGFLAGIDWYKNQIEK